MRIRVFGRYYELVFVPMPKHHGLCDAPTTPNKKIKIDSPLRNQKRLEILIHELLHACDYYKDEEWVVRAAHDIANVLWRLGYRAPDDTPPVDT